MKLNGASSRLASWAGGRRGHVCAGEEEWGIVTSRRQTAKPIPRL